MYTVPGRYVKKGKIRKRTSIYLDRSASEELSGVRNFPESAIFRKIYFFPRIHPDTCTAVISLSIYTRIHAQQAAVSFAVLPSRLNVGTGMMMNEVTRLVCAFVVVTSSYASTFRVEVVVIFLSLFLCMPEDDASIRIPDSTYIVVT